MYKHHMHTVPEAVRGGTRSAGARVTDNCELLWGCQESNLSPPPFVTEPSVCPSYLGWKVTARRLEKAMGMAFSGIPFWSFIWEHLFTWLHHQTFYSSLSSCMSHWCVPLFHRARHTGQALFDTSLLIITCRRCALFCSITDALHRDLGVFVPKSPWLSETGRIVPPFRDRVQSRPWRASFWRTCLISPVMLALYIFTSSAAEDIWKEAWCLQGWFYKNILKYFS